MNVLVTGGAGFIGHHLVKNLVEDNNVVYLVDDLSSSVIDVENYFQQQDISVRSILPQMLEHYSHIDDPRNPSVVFINSDFVHPSIRNFIETEKVETVFHLAAKPRVEWSVENPIESTAENFSKPALLARSCATGKARLIFSSTAAVYGDVGELPTKETNAKNPQSPYGLAKLCAEKYFELFEKLYDLDWVSLRYFNVYGPGQMGDGPYSTAVSAWCNATFSGKTLRSDGDGEQTRDMVYVGDVVDANILASEAPVDTVAGKSFNVATGSSISNNEILEMFKDQFEELIQVEHAPERPGDVRATLADVTWAETCLGFRAKVKFSEGLHRTWDWWADYTDDER